MNVAFTSTGYGPLWAPAVTSWLRVVAFTARHMQVEQLGKIGGAGVTDRTYTMTAENALVKQMLESESNFTHIFMTESDMILPHDCIVKLAALDKDIATGVYFLRHHKQGGRGAPCLWVKSDLRQAQISYDHKLAPYFHSPIRVFPQDHPFKVDAAGLGCVLFKREVFESRGLKNPWFDMKAGSEMQEGYGSDNFFYGNARLAGIETWVDPSVLCGQIDYYETDIEDYKWQLDNNPEFARQGYIIGTQVDQS